MANTSKNVGVGKPSVNGAIWRAPYGTKAPTSTSDTLAATWKCLGYISEDGLENENSKDVTTFKAWGGDPVATAQTEVTDTFKYTCIEALNAEVLKTVYGDDNVTVDSSSGMITVSATTDEAVACAYVIDTEINGGQKRIVIPNGKLTALDTITYKDDEVLGYGITITALAENGVTHTEYITPAK